MEERKSPRVSASDSSSDHTQREIGYESGDGVDEDPGPEPVLSSESEASSSTSESGGELASAIMFPAQQYHKLNDGLNRSSWVVHINCLIECERVAAALIRSPDRGGLRDLEIVRKFIREPLTEAFEKVLLDSAITMWGQHLQLQIFDAVIGLIDLTAAKLAKMDPPHAIDAAQAFEDEIDLTALLEPLIHAFDPESMFNNKNADCVLPNVLRGVPNKYAIPRAPEKSGSGMANSPRADVDDCAHFTMYSWPAYFVNYFGHRKGFQLLQQALANPKRMSLELLKHMLTTVLACLPVAAEHLIVTFETDFEELLTYIEEAIEENVERLSECGSDKMFQHLSAVFRNLFRLLSRSQTISQAEEMVSVVQCKFVLQMLSYSNFSKHLSAVRETNAVVKRALDLSAADHGAAMEKVKLWLQRHNIVGQLLRANLHQKQYVEQVQKVLRNLVLEGCLEQEHIALLWDLTEKSHYGVQPDTFEAVRINVFSMLAELAQLFNEEQLDFLFKKFESSAAKCTSDNKQGMLLLFRLAKVDIQGVMTKRILGLLWRTSLASPVPSGLDMTLCFADVLRDYALISRSSDTRNIALDYVSQLVQELNGTDKAVPALRVLRHLVAHSSNHNAPILAVLKHHDDMLELVLSSLQRFMGSSLQMRESQQQSLGAWQHFHHTAITHYSGFLFDLAECLYDEPLTWSFVKGLWETLVEGALVQHDKDVAFLWFCNVLQEGRSISGATEHSWAIIDRTSSQMLLTEKMAKLDPATLSKDGYCCFASYFNALAEEQQMETGSNMELNMPGIDFLWRVVLDMPSQESQVINASQAVVRASQEMLIKLYQQRNTDAPVSPALCEHFIRSCVGNLLAAADGVQTGDTNLTRQLSAQRAARCMQLLQDMIKACKGRTMPTRAAHAASFCGSPITVGVTAPNMHQTKYQVDLNINSYVGQLRQQVASKPAFSLPPARLRMFLGGKELLNDALLLHEAGFTPEQCVVNVMGVAFSNSYSSPDPEVLAFQEAASPALLLAQEHPTIYGVLLELADHCDVPDVRANAVQLLNCLPTHSQVLDSIRTALQGPQAAQDLESLLFHSQADAVASTRLLYTLQALSALLEPQGKMLQVTPVTPETKDETPETMSSGGSDELETQGKADEPTEHSAVLSPATLQQIVLQSGVIKAVLQAVRHAGKRSSTDIATTRSLYDTAHDMAYRLVSEQAGSVTLPNAATTQTATKQANTTESAVPVSPVPVQAAPVVGVGDVSSTTTLPEHAASEPQAQKMLIALQVVFFYLHEAFEAARGWSRELKHAGQDDDEPNVLPEADVTMVARSIGASMDILRQDHAALLLPFLQKSESRRLLVGVLLSEHHETCRELGAQFLQQFSLLSSVAHQWVLLLLSDSMAEAEGKPRFCSEYFQQFARVLQALPQQSQAVQQMELQTADQLLTDLVAGLPHLSTVDELDMRMQGKLELLLQLIRVLGSRCLASTDSQQLVHLLLTEYLFAEAHVRSQYTSLQQVPPAQLHAALIPRCSSAASRSAALKLLKELTSHSSVNLQTSLQLIQQLHLSAEGSACLDSMPLHAIRAPLNSFVGLKNGGATCYMNSVFQQLFMQPSIRKMLLAVPESSDDQTDNVFYQMQNMFANLALTNQDYYVPRCFWMAFKDYDGQRLNLREHQDAYEFFTRLQDTADQYLRDRRLTPVLQAVIGGKFAQQIICKGLPYRSEKEEEFYQLSLDVRGKQTLEESLDLYVQGELMEGDNQYFCEEASRKVDAIKRSCIKSLPHTLVIHLKRFEFDYETMTRWKIKDRFEFPQQLNMYKYTVEGLAEAEETEPLQAPSPVSDTNVHSKGQYEYELKGVVVHSGTAFAGHYYSYIKARPNDGCPASSDKWFCFDDINVESWDIINLDTDCFGGKYTLSAQHFSGPQQEYDRPNSAYMLFYERSGVLEPVSQPASSLTAAAEGQAEMPSLQQQQQQQQTDSANLQSPSLSMTSPEQSCTSQQAADASATQLNELQAGSPMQTQTSAASSPQAVHLKAQESLQEQPQPSPTAALKEHLSSGLLSPVLQQPKSSPSETPNIPPHLANLSPLKGVSTLDLGQDIVMKAADQEVLQPMQRAEFKPSSTVSLPANMPSHIHEGVIMSNLQLLRETHLMDRDYFKLIMTLVKGSSEICNHKIRRTGTADEEAVSLDPSLRSLGPSRRAEDSDSMAILAAEVAVIFLFKIYLRVPLHAREDLAEWRSILQNIMESSATATRLVLVTLAHPDAHRRQPLLEETILINSGEVREFASGVVHDALKIAVTLHHGEFDPSTEISADSMPAAVNNMVDALLQAGLALLRDDRSLDQAYFAQLLLLFRDYGCLGQLQRQHLANMPHMFEFAAQIVDSVYTYPGSMSQQSAELQAALLLLAMLMRLLDMTPLLTSGSVAANNPYKDSNAATVSTRLLAPGVLDAIPHMCRVEFFAEQAVRETLQYLSWENSDLSVKILDAVFAICKKADVQSLYQLAPHYAALVGLEDSLKQPRLQYFLVARRGVHENGPGIAGLLLANRANRQPWRRLALFRLMHLACRDSPEVVAKIIKSFPDVISHENITGTYHALAQDTVSPAMMLEIRSFLQDLLDLEAQHSEG